MHIREKQEFNMDSHIRGNIGKDEFITVLNFANQMAFIKELNEAIKY